MYEDFFGLRQRPFTPAPQVNRYFPAETIEQARVTVARCLDRAEGVAVVVGPSGTGKTLLCQMLRQRLIADSSVVMLSCGRLTSLESLYQTILFNLERPYRGMSENELRLDLINYLTDSAVGEQRLILLVDEAHTLSLKLLEELRMMMNIATDAGEPHIRVLLTGGPLLEERFTHPKLEPLSQRITTRCYLESFRQAETRQYIHAQIDAVGGDGPKLFTTKAAKAVFNATDGIPRLVNQVCDHALLLAAQQGKRQIDDREVEIAWADLQQLPTPWNDEVVESAQVIEFGTFDDSPTAMNSTSSSKRISHQNTTTDDLLADLTASSEVFDEKAEDKGVAEPLAEEVCLLDSTEIEETVESILSDLIQDSEPEPVVHELSVIQETVVTEKVSTSASSKTFSARAEDPFCEEFESEEVVVQPLAGRSPMVVPVDSPILTYTPATPEPPMAFSSELLMEGSLVDVGYSHAPPSVRDKLTLFSPDGKENETIITVEQHISRIFATLRRA